LQPIINSPIKYFTVYIMKRAIFILLATIFTSAYAQQKSLHNSGRITLDSLITKAIDKSYSVANREMEVEKTEIERKTVRNVFFPKISVGGGYAFMKAKTDLDFTVPNIIPILPYDGRYSKTLNLDGANIWDAGADASWILFTGFKATYGMKALKHKALAQTEMVKVERSKVIKETVLFHDRLAVIRQAEKVLQASAERLAEETKIAERALKEGLITSFDLRKIKIATLKLKSKQIELRGKKDLVLIRLNQLTGIAKENLNVMKIDFNMWAGIDDNKTIENRPEVHALNESIIANKYKLKSTYSGYMPKVVALGTVRYTKISENRSDGIEATLNPVAIVGVGLRWTLFDGFHTHHKSSQAKLDLLKAQNDLDNAKELMNLNLSKTLVDYNVSLEQLELKHEVKEEAKHYLRISIKEYREGLIKISERLEAETELQQSELEYLRAIQNQRQMTLNLLEATGKLNIKHMPIN